MVGADGFYYIMDYSGNHYRVDSQNQLVVVKDETEATIFSLADANKRIGAGAKSRFYFTAPVPMEETDATTPAIKEVTEEKVKEPKISVAKELAEGEVSDFVEKTISEYDLSSIDWKEYLLHFAYIVAGLKDYRESLVKAESDIDLKICDILHYVELCEMSDEEAAALMELLRVCREKRRDIKDEIIKVDAFQRTLGTSMNAAKAKEATKAIAGLETRKYTPRRFAELFEGGIMQMPTSGRKPHERRKETVEEAIEETMEETKELQEYHEEETQMEYIRKETVFDGKDNDWMAFGRAQAEFYQNAEQYIINLKLDMEEIDNAIWDLMQEIEVSNCNVTQGYRLFKRLKDLRLERKQKERELECLYILTEHFDVRALAEECECNLAELENYLGEESEDVKEPVEMRPIAVLDGGMGEKTQMVV